MTMVAMIQQYDALWKGSVHRNFCVAVEDGKAAVKVDGMPEYQLYFAQSDKKPLSASPIFAEGIETPGRIDIDTPDDLHMNGHVCLGVAK